jgi:hypothetical protein
MAGTGSIGTMRDYLQERLRKIDENRGAAAPDEDVRAENVLDRKQLAWKADEPGKHDDEEKVYLYVSSAARDRTKWPSPGQYQVIMDSELNNVIKADLVQASFPLTDRTVNSDNNKLRFLFGGGTMYTAVIPPGNYTGTSLALEITVQMQTALYAPNLENGSRVIDYTTGLSDDANNLRAVYDEARDMFRFQYLVNGATTSSSVTGLIVQPPRLSAVQETSRTANDDIYDLLGFDRTEVARLGASISYSGGAYYTLYFNQDYGAVFGPSQSPDTRYRYALHSSNAVDLRGPCAIVLDIDPLNDNDMALVENSSRSAFNIGNAFGLIYVRDPAFASDGMFDLSNSTYPIQKYYRDGRSRVKNLTITCRRPDGSIFDFNGAEHCMTIRLTVKRSQPKKAIFAR